MLQQIALRKSINKAWIPILPSREFSVLLNKFCVIVANADTVDLLFVNAC